MFLNMTKQAKMVVVEILLGKVIFVGK